MKVLKVFYERKEGSFKCYPWGQRFVTFGGLLDPDERKALDHFRDRLPTGKPPTRRVRKNEKEEEK